MKNVDNFISDINEELKKEQKTALNSIERIKLEKEMKSQGIVKELKTLDNRALKLKKVVEDINLHSDRIMETLESLRGQKKNKSLRLAGLKKDVARLKGIEDEIAPLQKTAKELASKREVKKKILSVKRKENRIKLAGLRRKEKELENLANDLIPMQAKIKEMLGQKMQKQKLRRLLSEQAGRLQLRLNNLVVSLADLKKKHASALHDLDETQAALENGIKEFNARIREKGVKQDRLVRLKKDIPLTAQKISDFGKREKELLEQKRQKQKLRRRLYEQARRLQLKLNDLAVSLASLNKKQINPLHSQIESLLRKKKQKQIIHAKLKLIVAPLKKSVAKHTSVLNNLEETQAALENRIKEFNARIREKKMKQDRLLRLKKDIPLTAQKISDFGKREKELLQKKQAVFDLKSRVKTAHAEKQQERKKLQETIKKLREQEKKLKNISL